MSSHLSKAAYNFVTACKELKTRLVGRKGGGGMKEKCNKRPRVHVKHLPHRKVLASWQTHTCKHHYLCHCIPTHLSHWFVLVNQKGKGPEMDSQQGHWILYLTYGWYLNFHCSQWFWVSYPKEPVQMIKHFVNLDIYSDPIKSRIKVKRFSSYRKTHIQER